MQGHDIIVIGLSAGGIEPLLQLVADLPSDLPAALFVVHHFPAHSITRRMRPDRLYAVKSNPRLCLR